MGLKLASFGFFSQLKPRIFCFLWLFGSVLLTGSSQAAEYGSFEDGDLIFQISQSFQSQAIKTATGSEYSHCGIVFDIKGQFYVLETLAKTMTTPLENWIKRGVGGHYVLMRLKNRAQLDQKTILAMKKVGRSFLGREYDLKFRWSDDQLYCSELVWKVYKNGAGIELVPLKKMKDYNLSDENVKKLIEERYGQSFPYDENVVAPSDLMDSGILEKVSK